MKTIIYILRRLNKEKLPNYLGIAGLATGLACVMFIFLWIHDEASFDRFHKNIDRIFITHAFIAEADSEVPFDGAPPAVAGALKAEYPQVLETARIIPAYSTWLLNYRDKKITPRIGFCDFSMFDIFTFEFVAGPLDTEKTPYQIIINETTAHSLFGETNPLGEILRFDNSYDLMVVGVIKDVPRNSSLIFDGMVTLELLPQIVDSPNYLNTWWNNSFLTAGLLNDPAAFPEIAKGVRNRIQEVIPETNNHLGAYMFQDLYLYKRGNVKNIGIFTLIGILILCTAILNFINLITARSLKQIRENGIRKSLGATRLDVVKFIYSEVSIVCIIAFVAAVLITAMGLPFFNQLINKDINLETLANAQVIKAFIVVLLITIGLSGVYPAVVLSRYSPVQSIRGAFSQVRNGGLFRNALVISVFISSIALLSATLIINKQIRYLQNLDLGFEKERVVYFRLNGNMKQQPNAIKNMLLTNPNIVSASTISHPPSAMGNNGQGWQWENKPLDFDPLVFNWNGDPDLVKTLQLHMSEGSFLQEGQTHSVVINRCFAQLIGWSHFTGKTLSAWGNDYQIAGVFEDININSLGGASQPIAVFLPDGGWGQNFMAVKIAPQDVDETLTYIQKKLDAMEPAFINELTFLEDDFTQMLEPENNLQKLISLFTLFSILVLALGLTGMIMYMAEKKTKEIGIRKSLGEENLSIVSRMLSPLLTAGLVAALIATPLAWSLMGYWLQNYAKRIDIDILIFIQATLAVMLVACATVLLHISNAATKNPVDALRSE